MAFAIYLRYRENFQPETPQILDKAIHDSNVRFTFVDFIPSVVKRSGTMIPQGPVEYHSFSEMIELANEWLKKHGQNWEVVNCETIIILYKYNVTNNFYEMKPNDCCFYIFGTEKNNVLKAFRMWVRRKVTPLESNDNEQNYHGLSHQVIKFKNLIPKHRNNDISLNFEDLDDLIHRFNEEMITKGLPGKIITVESISYETNNEWKLDLETSLSTLSTKNMFILRIFYAFDENVRTHDQIGLKDFHPKLMTRATFFKKPKFETFDKVIERGSSWLRDSLDLISFINAQSIDLKIKSQNSINTRQTAYTEYASGDYMRIFRIAYRKSQCICQRSPVILSTRLFLPHNKTDTIDDIKQRLSNWLNKYLEKSSFFKKNSQSSQEEQSNSISKSFYPSVLSAETVEVFAKDFRDNSDTIEKAAIVDTFLANRFGNKNAYMIFSLRIFYDVSQLSSATVISTDSAAPNTPNQPKRKAISKNLNEF